MASQILAALPPHKANTLYTAKRDEGPYFHSAGGSAGSGAGRHWTLTSRFVVSPVLGMRICSWPCSTCVVVKQMHLWLAGGALLTLRARRTEAAAGIQPGRQAALEHR